MAKDIAILDMSNPETKKLVLQNVKAAKGLHWFTFTLARNQRSLKQNAYWHAVVIPHTKAGLQEAWGNDLDNDLVHEFLKDKFLSVEVVDRFGEIHGKYVRSTTSLDKKEFSNLVDAVVAWALEYLNTRIPLPNEIAETDWYHKDESEVVDADWSLTETDLDEGETHKALPAPVGAEGSI